MFPSYPTFVFWEANGQRGSPDFLLEKVLLVEEENDGSLGEPLVVADRVEQLHRLHHSVHLIVLCQHHVVL